MAAFAARNGEFRFLLVNVHLFFGSESKKDIERRALETFAVFHDVFEQKTAKQFLAYVRFHMSDHRLLWAQFNV